MELVMCRSIYQRLADFYVIRYCMPDELVDRYKSLVNRKSGKL